MVHRLVAPLQHQTADQHHAISWHHQCKSCHWPAILDNWCNQWHWCASGKKQGRSGARNCHHFSAPRNQCAMTRWSWPSCHEVEYDRHLLHSPRGMQIYSYWMEMMQKMGTPVPYGGFPLTNLKFKTWLHLKMLINMETPLTNSNCPPPLTALVRKSTCLLFQYNNLIQKICASFAIWLSVLFCLISIVWSITTNIYL